MRMIFSTVFGPHDPALTVGSLAITETGRPPIVPLPVTTPSAPRPSSSQLASSPSSTNEPSSSKRATRSRTGSLPCSAALARWRSGPPERARSRACSTSLMPVRTLAGGDRRAEASMLLQFRAVSAAQPVAEPGPTVLLAMSDDALAAAAARGGRDAFGELYRRHHDAVYRYCLGILRCPEDAHDAVQATMTRAMLALERREAPGSWRAWLFSIAHNEAVDQLRRRRDHAQLRDAEGVAASALDRRVEARARLAA